MLWRCGQAEYRRACLGVCSTAPHTKSPSFASLLGSPPARFQVEICAQLSPFLQRLGSAELRQWNPCNLEPPSSSALGLKRHKQLSTIWQSL